MEYRRVSKEERDRLAEEFIHSEQCQMCGSQRCEASGEWLDACLAFRKYARERRSSGDLSR